MLSSIKILQLDYIAGFFLFCFILVIISKLFKKKPKARSRKRYQHSLHEKQQIFTNHNKREEAVKHATFERRQLLNKGEKHALNHIQKMIMHQNLPFHIYPQVPLLAFIQETTTVDALQLQKGLRPDFVLTDYQQNVIAVIEINGTGHHDKFDRSKTMILNSVGIKVINIDTNGWNRLSRIPYETFCD